MTESEKRLVIDCQLFDEFLHVTNEAAFEAMKMAETESEKHSRKMSQIKDLHSKNCELRSEICRFEDQFQYKDEIKQFIFLMHNNQNLTMPVTMTSKAWKEKWANIVSISKVRTRIGGFS